MFPLPVKPDPMSPYTLAKSYIGCKEIPGKADNPTILGWLRRFVRWPESEDVPWCSAFVNAMAEDRGYERTKSLAARSWLNVGIPVRLDQAQPGDVVVLWRGSPTADTGHVAFFDHREGMLVHLLGGNQSDTVCVAPYPASRVLGVRRLRKLSSLTVQ